MADKRGRSGRRAGIIGRRVPLRRQIELRFPHFQGLLTGVSSNLSSRGMFIQSDHPESAGTELSFRFRIEDWSPIQGTAKVAWIRPRAEGPDRPAGMGVEFVEVDAQSRRLIHWLVERHIQSGGEPFDIGSVPSGAARILTEMAEMESPGQTQRRSAAAAEARSSKGTRDRGSHARVPWGPEQGRRSRTVLGVVVVIVAALSAYLLWVDSRPGNRPLRRGRATTSTDHPGARTGIATQRQTIGTESVAPAPSAAEAVTAVVQRWASAWESRQASRLLVLYSQDFEPEDGRSRRQWEAEIEREMSESDFIRVAVSALQISSIGPDAATVSFYRSAQTNRVDRSGRVILELQAVDGDWKIHRERNSS